MDKNNNEEIEINTSEENVNIDVLDEEQMIITKDDIKGPFKKRKAKLMNTLMDPNDIKYVGPLSYRHLRILAWITLAIAQFLLLSNISQSISGIPIINNEIFYNSLDLISSLSTPFFLLAMFATIFNRKKTYRSTLIIYALAYLAISFGFLFIFNRYILMLGTRMGFDVYEMETTFSNHFGSKAQINVFADLLSLTLIHFFINYIPTKYFKGNKIIIFRLLVILPLIYLTISYILIGLNSAGTIILRLETFPFLASKSPVVHILFITLSTLMKNREKLFLRNGGTKEKYAKYLNTNKNSLSFSIQASILFAIFSLIDFILLISIMALSQMNGMNVEQSISFATDLGFGKSSLLFIAIPFILLFSYKKTHKDGYGDIIVPLIGLGLIGFAYIEGIYEIIINIMNSAQ